MSISATCSSCSDASPSDQVRVQVHQVQVESDESASRENQWNPSSISSDPIPSTSRTTSIPTSTSTRFNPGSTIPHPTLAATGGAPAATVATATSLILLNLLSTSTQSLHRRHSYSSPSTLFHTKTKQIRSAQLNLLAQQANLASTGTSSLQDAKAVNLVLGAAVAIAAQRRASLGNGFKESRSIDGPDGNASIHSDGDDDERGKLEQEEINHHHPYPSASASASAKKSSKGTREYSERLSKIFGDIGEDGSNFLNLAGQVARDYATFYKAEREWTGRALRRQSEEEDQSQVESESRNVSVSPHPALGKAGPFPFPLLSQVEEVDEVGIFVDKGKKRDLDNREDFSSSEISSTSFLSKEKASKNKRRKSSGIQLEPKSTSSFDPGSSPSPSALDSQTPITSLNPTNPSKSISSSAHSNQAEISPSSSSNRAAFSFQAAAGGVNPTISITPPSNDSSPIPTSIPSFESSGSSSNSYDSNLTMRKSREKEFPNSNPISSPTPTRTSGASFNQPSKSSQSCLIKSTQIHALNAHTHTHNHTSPPRLTSVLSNFATLLDSRQESCQGLESLVSESRHLSPLPKLEDFLNDKNRGQRKNSE